MPEFVPQEKLPQEAQFVPEDKLPADMRKEAKAPEESEPSLFRRAFSTVKGMPIPMATTAAGAALGAPFGPVGMAIGAMGGGGGGEWLNQKLGLTDPSLLDIGISAATGPFGQTARPGVLGAKSLAVKTLAGRANVAEAAENVLTRLVNPKEAAASLYKKAESLGLNIPAKKTLQQVENFLAEEGSQIAGATQQELVNVLTPVKEFYSSIGKYQVAQPVKNMMAEVRRLGADASAAFEAGKTELGYVINKVRATLLDDLEASGAGIVKEASKTSRKEHAIKDLANLLGKPHPHIKLNEFIKKNPLFEGAFEPAEMAQIQRIVKKLEFVTPSGGAGFVGKAVTGGVGAKVGGWWGALLALVGTEGIRGLLSSKIGRNMTEKVLEGTYQLDGPRAAALAMIARGLQQGATGQLGAGGETE